MHFRFHFDGHRHHRNFAGRGARWAGLARAFSDEFGGEFDGRDDDPRRGPRRRRRFGAEALKILILHLLKAEPRHGYDLIKAIEAMSAGLYAPSPGMVYPLLNLLADEGLIAELPAELGRRRYAITDSGRAALDAAEAQLKEALERLAHLARNASEDSHDDRRRALRSAMHDLRASVRNRMDNPQQAQAIADILRDAAAKIDAL